MIQRKKHVHEISKRLTQFPVVAILGARQCGKTTLARQIPSRHLFDLENPRDLGRLENAQLALEDLRGTVLIDEIQRRPELFPLLRCLVDERRDRKFLILGSASRDLIRQSSESLAGRIAYYYLPGFSLDEVGTGQQRRLWVRGGFPRAFLAHSQEESLRWRENFIATFLERDIPQLGITTPAATLRRFWIMLSHYHGQILNFSELGRSFGVSDVTARKYIDLLAGTFMVRLLPPWFSNTSKRLVKSPKLYLRDSGLFHTLQSIDDHGQLATHPKLGASWEGFALETVTQVLGIEEESLFFWATHGGAELDLYWERGSRKWGVEFKYADAPRLTKSMRSALEDLGLEHLWIVCPAGNAYPLADNVTAVPLAEVQHHLIQYQKIRATSAKPARPRRQI